MAHLKKLISHPIFHAVIAFAVGLVITCGLHRWKIAEIGFLGCILSFFVAFIIYQVSENHQIKKEFIDIIRHRYDTLRRVPLKYEELKKETIRKFIERNNGAHKVFSTDRMDPDSWFFNDNYITFLTLQAKRIKESSPNKPYEAHRALIWRKDLYNDSRNKQLIMMNSYAGVKTYLIPVEFIERMMHQFLQYLKTKMSVATLPQKMRMKGNWLEWLIKKEEFLLVESGDTIIGMGKREEAGVISDEDLCETEGYVCKYFFDWLIKSTCEDDKIISLINLDNISAADPYFLEKVETKIINTVEQVMKRE